MRICSSSAWFQSQLTLESPRSTPKPNLKQGIPLSLSCVLFVYQHLASYESDMYMNLYITNETKIQTYILFSVNMYNDI